MKMKLYMRMLLLTVLVFTAAFSMAQTINVTAASGNNAACLGSSSANPNIQQFTANGTGLTANILLTAPADFEVSTNAGSGYAASLTLNRIGPLVLNTTIFVRSAATAPVGAIAGNVTLTSAGATTRNVSVSGTVNAIPNVNAVVNQTVCNNTSTAAINFSGAVAGTVYNWTNSNTAIGLAASGSGDIAGFNATNATNAPITGTITVTPSFTNAGVTCTGAPTTFTIIVNPTATVNAVSGQTICNNGTSNAVVFSGSVAGTVYNWTNSNPAIGLAASGTGNIAAFTATNATANPISGTITVTPSATFGAVTCTGASQIFTITVNPTATVDAVASQVVCYNSLTSAINFSSPSTGFPASTIVYDWVNTEPSIGLPASGTGDIPAFTATNSGTAPLVANITVTPTFTYNGVSCMGTATTFTFTVQPAVTVNAVTNQVLCNGSSTAAINFGSTATGGTITYDWTNSDPSIGIAASGSGNIATFTAVNTTAAPKVATITVTPTLTSGAVSCTGTAMVFTITVNPTATVNAVANQDLCNGDATTAITFTSPTSGGGGSNIVFNWVNNTPSIGLAASGTGDIASFVANNATLTPVTATITVTPTYTNGGVSCAGTPLSFTIMVLPTVSVNPVANQVFCNGLTTPVINFSSPNSGGTINYTWDNSDPSIGLAAFDSGNLPSFTATNTTSSPVTAIITVRAQILNTTETISCNGTSRNFTITVNPTPSVNAVADQLLCANTVTTPINFGGPVAGSTYSWTNNNTAIGLAASGTGSIPSFTTVNNQTSAITATITVTPIYTNAGVTCTGAPISFTITVNPIATVNIVTDQVLCNGSSTAAIHLSGPATGTFPTVFAWTNSDPSIGIPAAGIGDIASFIANNTTTVPIVATITVTPFIGAGGPGTCPGTPMSFTITVNPTATVDGVPNPILCNGSFTTPIIFTSPNSGGGGSNVVFNWVNNTPSIGLAASGSGNIGSFTAINLTNAEVRATITVTPVYTNAGVTCAGTARTITITVYPTATVNSISDQTVCNGASTAAVNFTGSVPGTEYDWTNSTPSIGLAASGTGNIGSFVATNATAAPVTATITVTPSFTNALTCTGTPTTFTITVNPVPTVNTVTNQVVCNTASTTAINFTGATAGTIYNWTNSTPSIGLAASGTGNIASFAAINTGTSPVTATITVTPSYNNAGTTCTGASTTFTITVNPTATVNSVASQVLCNGSSTAAISFSSPATGGTVTYAWTNSTPSIGIAAGGTGNIPSFTAANATTAPIVATITVTPTFTNGAVSCVGTPTTFTITVNPTATVDAVPNQVLCNGATTNAITFTSPNSGNGGSNIVFNWVNNTPSIGLAASGTGDIGSFTATNTSNAPVTATITVTPVYTNAGVTCTGTLMTFTITVNPTATVNAVASQTLCNGAATSAINFSSPNSGGSIVYNWVNNTPSIGLAATGAGNIASFAATNATAAPVTATITVTPTITNGALACVGTSITFTITVNPTASVNAVPNQVLCANTVTTPIVFSGPVSGTTYSWVNNNPSIGLAASGTGNIPSFTTSNTLTNATTATITVTPTTPSGCTGVPITFTITVNPIATVNPVANQVLCNGSSTAAVVFSSPTTGGSIVYNWVNNTPSIGIAASGTGNIPTFIATNATTAPIVATITVTPTLTNGAVSCVGTPITFIITVNPTATVNAVANQALCNGTNTTAIAFSSPNSGNGGSNVVFNWLNNTPSIGLAASGTGNIGSFTATNVTTAPVVATITVTPVYTNAGVTCTGTSITFTITVNPTATVNAVANQSLCNNTPTAAVNFSTIYTGGSVVYNWVNSAPSIGLAATGSGNIASFIATNATNAPVTATITVTPTFTNGSVSCVGTSSTFTITVNPTGNVNAISNQVLCANTTTLPIVFTSGVSGTTYSWVNNNPSIGLAASGTGNIPSFVTSNTITNAITATITVTPTSPNGCTGLPITFTITVNPIATVNIVANQVLCNGSSTAAVAFSSPTTGGNIIYSWTNSAPSIGLAANGIGNLPTFIATNSTTTPVIASITVTPTFVNGVSCVGTPTTFTITVNPTATVNAVANQVLCNGSGSNAITFTSPNSGNGGSNVVFNWTNNTPSIGLAASGSGNIASFIATNTTNAPVVATITVTPTYTNAGVSCVGTAMTFNVTVNPTATVNAIANQSLCNGVATAAVNFSSTYTGGSIVYNWVNNTPSIGLAATGSGNIASFISTNTTNAPVTATITVTPTFTNGSVSCVGTSSTFTITVNPTAVVNAVANQSLCANTTTAPIVFSSPVSGTTYTWVNNNPAIGLAANGVGNIPSFVTTNNVNSINATITVTPNSPFGCTGLPITFVITVNPIATVNVVSNQILCNGRLTDSIKFSSPNGTNGGGTIVYNWTNNAPSIGIPATGSGNILPFIATNTGAAPVIALITVTPSFVNGTSTCVGIPTTFSITVNPTAVVNAIANQTVCAGQSTSAVSFTGPVASTIYNWVNSNPTIGLAASGTGNIASFVAQNPTFSTITGTVTVVPNTAAGCVGASRSFDYIIPALSVAPTAISTPALVLCDTNTVTTLRVVGGGLGTGANWVWYRDACGGTPIGTGAVLNNVTVGSTTTFYVRAEGTCNITTCASVRIQVAKLITHVRQHWSDVLFFDNSSNNFVKWQWYKNGALVPGATQQHYSESGGLNGNYYVVATDKNGIELLTCPLDIAAGGFTGIELKISPNPVQKGQTYRLISSLTPAQLQGASITVKDIIGTQVTQTNTASTVTTLQAPNAAGMYIVTLVLRNGQKYSVTMIVH